jgi:hypothetical protein
MTMHLEGPWLSTTGRKRGPKKWASAEAKRKHDVLKESWEALKQANNVTSERVTRAKDMKSTLTVSFKAPPGREAPRIVSQDTGWVACTTPANQEYTGTKVKGIGTMHKSNAVPIFSDEEAVDISKMRR